MNIKPYIEIIQIAWPLAIGMMNNALLQFTDRAFLAHESMTALEAVLPANMLSYITVGFFQSVVAFAGTFVAQYYGAKNEVKCRESYYAGMWIALFSGIISLIAIPIGSLVFDMFSNGAEVAAQQKVYYNISIAGGIFLYGQMSAQAYFTGIGRTRLVLGVNVIGNLINVGLDAVLIFGYCGLPRLGIAGAAYATVISMLLQWIVLAICVRKEMKRFSWSEVCNLEVLRLIGRVLRFGVPSGAYSVLNILSFTIFVFFTGAVGHVAAAVSNACFSVCYLLAAPMEGIALGAATLVGHARGRGDDDEAMKIGLRTMYVGAALAFAMSLVVLIFRHPILGLYVTNDSSQAAEFHTLGTTLFGLMALWQMFDASDVIISGALKGAGDTKFVMWWMLIVAFFVWLPLVWVASQFSNTMPVLWGTMILYIVILCVGSVIRWRRASWKRVKLV